MFSTETLVLNGAVRLKKAFVVAFSLSLVASLMAGCGGGDQSNTQNNLSNLKNRAFVTNSFFGRINVIDADRDAPSRFFFNVGATPTFMVPTPDKTHVATYASGSNSVVLVETAKESATASVTLPDWSESIAITADAKTGYAAVKNAPVTGQNPGAIQVLDFVNQKIGSTIPVESVRWIALNHKADRLLAFSDQSDVVRIVDLSATTPAATVVPGPFFRPVAAYFSTDDTKAYILSCGSECGATGAIPPDTLANVTELTIATGATRTVPVNAATVGLLDGDTLYVAGAPDGSGGTLDTINVGMMTRTSSVNIGPGQHKIMKLAAGKIWIGATDCGTSEGCLSIYTPGGDVIVDTPGAGQTTKGSVTGMSLVNGRNRMYVVEGGQLLAYDTTTGADVTPFSLDVQGKLSDVLTIP